MDFPSRLEQLLSDKQLKYSEFCDITGFDRSNLSNLVRGKVKKPSLDIAITIATHFPEVNLHWLLTGKGEMYRSAAEMLPGMLAQEGERPAYGNENAQLLDTMQAMNNLLQQQNKHYEKMIIERDPELAKLLGLL